MKLLKYVKHEQIAVCYGWLLACRCGLPSGTRAPSNLVPPVIMPVTIHSAAVSVGAIANTNSYIAEDTRAVNSVDSVQKPYNIGRKRMHDGAFPYVSILSTEQLRAMALSHQLPANAFKDLVIPTTFTFPKPELVEKWLNVQNAQRSSVTYSERRFLLKVIDENRRNPLLIRIILQRISPMQAELKIQLTEHITQLNCYSALPEDWHYRPLQPDTCIIADRIRHLLAEELYWDLGMTLAVYFPRGSDFNNFLASNEFNAIFSEFSDGGSQAKVDQQLQIIFQMRVCYCIRLFSTHEYEAATILSEMDKYSCVYNDGQRLKPLTSADNTIGPYIHQYTPRGYYNIPPFSLATMFSREHVIRAWWYIIIFYLLRYRELPGFVGDNYVRCSTCGAPCRYLCYAYTCPADCEPVFWKHLSKSLLPSFSLIDSLPLSTAQRIDKYIIAIAAQMTTTQQLTELCQVFVRHVTHSYPILETPAFLIELAVVLPPALLSCFLNMPQVCTAFALFTPREAQIMLAIIWHDALAVATDVQDAPLNLRQRVEAALVDKEECLEEAYQVHIDLMHNTDRKQAFKEHTEARGFLRFIKAQIWWLLCVCNNLIEQECIDWLEILYNCSILPATKIDVSQYLPRSVNGVEYPVAYSFFQNKMDILHDKATASLSEPDGLIKKISVNQRSILSKMRASKQFAGETTHISLSALYKHIFTIIHKQDVINVESALFVINLIPATISMSRGLLYTPQAIQQTLQVVNLLLMQLRIIYHAWSIYIFHTSKPMISSPKRLQAIARKALFEIPLEESIFVLIHSLEARIHILIKYISERHPAASDGYIYENACRRHFIEYLQAIVDLYIHIDCLSKYHRTLFYRRYAGSLWESRMTREIAQATDIIAHYKTLRIYWKLSYEDKRTNKTTHMTALHRKLGEQTRLLQQRLADLNERTKSGAEPTQAMLFENAEESVTAESIEYNSCPTDLDNLIID